ncbi:MAG: preprotein translocase subunit SecA [Planctomycetota bacterium]|nr:preprotein translocase subunit SecA [Planctomycetota bacterium]MDA0919108.1 preprotein translocase subunit SecA [Planctomycetota bacterium]
MDTLQKLGDSVGKIGDLFTAVTSTVERSITGMFGSSNERRVKNIGFVREKNGESKVIPGSLIDQIGKLESKYQALSEDELRQTSARLRARLDAGETLDDILPDAFAAAREAGFRYLKMRHYDVQLVGGIVLHRGMIAEMTTGEGKTLVATLPTYLNALAGKVHVITVNDYLARRDMEWMAPLYMGLGLTVGAIQANMHPEERRKVYACDITYGTNNEFGFDYLRDNMKPTRELQAQGPLQFALIDEIDNILIDEARTPLIISGPAHDDTTKYPKADQIARKLKPDLHYEVKEKEHTCHLTDEGIRYAEELAGVESFYTAGNMHWPHLIDNSLKAHHLYKRDVSYVVENGDVVIIDEFTGRKMTGRQWSDGLHQAVEAKEGVRIKQETQTLATITLQNFFRLYDKLAGMTGTAMTEADEFLKIYGLDVISVPTNRPMQRINQTDVIYRSEREKWNAVIDEIREVHATGRPVLVGTVSIEKSEHVSGLLKKYGIQHSLLNAKFHEREAEIVAQAGRLGAVTLSTNMAGRGTDIVLGGNPEHLAWEELSKIHASRLDVSKAEWDEVTERIAQREGMKEEARKVAALGGLHVVGTERHDSRRIDLQLRGRSGRQGDPGSSRFFVSLEDDLMRIFMGDWVKTLLTNLGMQEGEAIESGMVSRRIEAAQKKVEERHFETRKHLLEYDEVMDEQRKRVYTYRQRILDGGICRDLVLEMIDRQVEQFTEQVLHRMYRWRTICDWCATVNHLEITPDEIRDMERDLLMQFVVEEAKRQADETIAESLEENLPELEDEAEWNWQAQSRWINSMFGLNTNDRELKKVGRHDLHVHVYNRACEAIDRYDLTPLEMFHREDWGAVSLASWLYQQYTLQIDPSDLEGLEPEAAIAVINQRVRDMYREKEVRFPVTVGFNGFTVRDGGGERLDRDGLVRWANSRFEIRLAEDDLGSIANLEKTLLDASRKFLERGNMLDEIERQLDAVYGPVGEAVAEEVRVANADKVAGLVNWSNSTLKSKFTEGEFARLTRKVAEERILEAHSWRFRPELHQTERSVILEILDTAWKNHLYDMDRLRSAVGLVGYAQKDPKVEYRREGMKSFGEMWDTIGTQVTGAIFRLEHENSEFVGSLWEITNTVHESAGSVSEMSTPAPAGPDGSGYSENGPEAGQSEVAIEPIRNRGDKVGRNDPCPCGSGKKYKKCCGAFE